jgi:hypothetical protein
LLTQNSKFKKHHGVSSQLNFQQHCKHQNTARQLCFIWDLETS